MTKTEECWDTILERIADGESLRTICADEDMPDKANVFRYLAKPENAEARDQYARAREEQADSLVDEMIDIADEATGDDVQQARLRIDARKWIAGKMRPKKYGEKLELSGDPEAPVPIAVVERTIVQTRAAEDS